MQVKEESAGVCLGTRGCSMWSQGWEGQSGLIMRDLKCPAEVMGLYPKGPREPCKGFEESHDQLDVLERRQ